MADSKPSILIADDNAVSLELLRGILWNFGCREIRKFRDGKEAFDAYVEEKSDILFLDIDMPGLNGLEMLRIIRTMTPGAFAVIVSGENSTANIKESLALGAEGFIVKPYSPSRIQDILDKFQKTSIAGAIQKA